MTIFSRWHSFFSNTNIIPSERMCTLMNSDLQTLSDSIKELSKNIISMR